ncbi:MAG TPA: carboxypeptidase-like regulatory domain-containing protein, partial [Vicinamibacterales bacterium]|nr:carboxypeptidase-like regulatory domain-containing protein [Vicinamibacterales bacterium]
MELPSFVERQFSFANALMFDSISGSLKPCLARRITLALFAPRGGFMTRQKAGSTGVIALLFCILVPDGVLAQSAGIAGLVKDTTGAVIPGVTVEAASPALIEKVRTVVTDEKGAYKIIDLRPGVYTVTFALVGFSTVKREGIELVANFTANVNAELRVGALEETVTVSGQSSLVDVQNVVQQSVVSAHVMETIPNSRTLEIIGQTLVPGMVSGGTARPTGQDVGGTAVDARQKLGIHGSNTNDFQPMLDGIPQNATTGVAAGGINMDAGAVQEYTYEVGALSAERTTGGVQTNTILKDGGNMFSGTFYGSFSNHTMESDNSSASLRSRGLTAENTLDKNWDINPSGGGPIKRDKLWIYLSTRAWGTEDDVANMWYALDPASPIWKPDLSRRALDDSRLTSESARPTWQLTPKNKFEGIILNQGRCLCHSTVSSLITPEAATKRTNDADSLQQVVWTSTVTNRILLEAGAQHYRFDQYYRPTDQALPNATATTELSTGLNSRAPAAGYQPLLNWIHNYKASVSYVTGSHAAKIG